MSDAIQQCPETAAHGVHACTLPAGHNGEHRWDFERDAGSEPSTPVDRTRRDAALDRVRVLLVWLDEIEEEAETPGPYPQHPEFLLGQGVMARMIAVQLRSEREKP